MTRKYSEGYPKEDRSFQYLLGYYMGLSVYVLEDPNIMNQGHPEEYMDGVDYSIQSFGLTKKFYVCDFYDKISKL